MKFGDTRYGPLPPSTFQFGKYEILTSTGTLGLSTSKDNVSTPCLMLWIATAGNARFSTGPIVVPDP